MSNLYLIDDVTAKDIRTEPMKKGYSRGLIEAGNQNENVVAASSDVAGSTGTDAFAKEFPDRFIEVGVAEQNLVTVGSGLAAMGKMPFVAAYAAFSPGRNWEQIRTTIALNDRPVKIVSTHVGLSDAPDGATHQMLEDIALMRALPNMTVIAPCDSMEAAKATLAIAQYNKPAYMRIARDDTAIITTDRTPFEIGKAYVYAPGSDITIIATGRMTYYALVAAERLFKDGIDAEVIHCPTIKPLDTATILKSVRKTKAVITAEEGQVNGGFGGAIAELLGEEYPVPLKRIGMQDCFGESGTPKELFEHFGLTAKHIMLAAHEVIARKA
ncbi:MAG TPA: transketolase C-terminal domain-containing protein [Candidatus Saccharimonadales bacterium]|nr:transketolase C-terminal domain-containing protein [Candidatus Saccharimonadales bacterium]